MILKSKNKEVEVKRVVAFYYNENFELRTLIVSLSRLRKLIKEQIVVAVYSLGELYFFNSLNDSVIDVSPFDITEKYTPMKRRWKAMKKIERLTTNGLPLYAIYNV